MSMMWLSIPLAFVMDMVLGDPAWPLHPVRLMGHAIKVVEPRLRAWCSPRVGGAVLAVGLPLTVAVLAWGLIWLAGRSGVPFLDVGVSTLILYFCFATRDLYDHAKAVAEALEQGDVDGARLEVGKIVGRDTQDLDEGEVCRAAVESVAESASDGVVAPLFWACVGGAPLALAFKAVSTLDSMVGYKDERYLLFGRASARLDDVVNWLPARLTVVFTMAAAWMMGLAAGEALHTAREDGPQQPSPNSGWPEGAFAGALGVQLGGVNQYHGVKVNKPLIGEPLRPLGAATLRLAMALLLVTAVVAAAAATLGRAALCLGGLA